MIVVPRDRVTTAIPAGRSPEPRAPSPGPWAALKESDSAAVSARLPPRIFRRVPFEAELRLRYEPGGAEVVARTVNISLGGMFVISDDPGAAGTTFELSFKLPEHAAPVRGRGRVIWVRGKTEAPDRPAGMGVRFLELTPGSRELIFEVVERHVRDGGSPYDTGGEDSATIADRRDDTGSLPAAPLAGADDTLAGADGVLAGAEDTVTGGAGAVAAAPLPAEPAAPPAAAPAVRKPVGAAPAAPAGVQAAGGLAEPAAGPTPAQWDVAREEHPTPPPGGTPAAPWRPVEMPEPEPRPSHRVAGSAYAGRSRRGPRGAWLAGGAVVVVAAVAGYLLLAGGETREAVRDAAPAGPAAASAAGARGGGEGGTGAGDGGAAEPAGRVPSEAEQASAPEAGSSPAAPAATGDERAAGAPGRDGTARASADPVAEPAPDRAAGAGGVGEPAAAAAPRPAGRAEAAAAGGAERAGEPRAAEAPARRVTRIAWRREDGATELEIWGDGRFAPGSYRSSSLGGERPRALIRLTGIVEPFAGGSLEVGTPEVSRVRTGLHLETDPAELHVVIDLAGPGVAASELRADGARLWLRLEGR